jgi:hypothetical protein
LGAALVLMLIEAVMVVLWLAALMADAVKR